MTMRSFGELALSSSPELSSDDCPAGGLDSRSCCHVPPALLGVPLDGLGRLGLDCSWVSLCRDGGRCRGHRGGCTGEDEGVDEAAG